MAGRKQVEIPWKQVNLWLEAGCTGTECAASLGIAPITLYRACEREHKVNFEAYLQQKRASGDKLLRVAQMKTAIKGDKAMLIWLGKQRLGQSDKSDMNMGVTKKPVNLDDLTEEELAALAALTKKIGHD